MHVIEIGGSAGTAGGLLRCATAVATVIATIAAVRTEFRATRTPSNYRSEDPVIFPSNCRASGDAEASARRRRMLDSSPYVSTNPRLIRGVPRARAGRHRTRVGAVARWRAGLQAELRVLSHRRAGLSRPESRCPQGPYTASRHREPD